MRSPYTISRPVYGPDGLISRPAERDDLALVLFPRATRQTGATNMAAKNDPFNDHKVADPSFIQWDKEGIEITGVVRGIRDQPGRNGQVAHFFDLAVGRADNGSPIIVSCSIPTTLYQKVQAANVRIGMGVKILYTGQRKTGSGNNVKDFDFYALPASMDLKTLPADTWGVKNGVASDKPPIEDNDGEELPF